MQPQTDEIAEADPCVLQQGTASGGEEFNCFLDGHKRRVLKVKEASEKFKNCADKKKKKNIADFEEKVNWNKYFWFFVFHIQLNLEFAGFYSFSFVLIIGRNYALLLFDHLIV